MSGYIGKYQMISDDPSWTEVILGDPRSSQVISSGLGNAGWSHSISGSPKYFERALQKSVDIFGDFRRSEVTSRDVKSCQVVSLNIRWCEVISAELRWSYVISEDHSWSQVISDNIEDDLKLISSVASDLRQHRVIPGDLKLIPSVVS